MSLSREVSNRVFSNHLLMDKIMDFAIHDGGGKVNYSTVKSCRLVGSTWLQSVNTSLREAGEPLLKYDSRTNSLKKLDVLLGSAEREIPPIRMSCYQTYLPETVNSYFPDAWDILSRFQTGLVILEVDVPEVGYPQNPNYLHLSFPFLRKLSVRLGYLEEIAEIVPNSNVTTFIQLILSGCAQLTHFTLLGGDMSGQYVPLEFENIQLPPTLTEVSLDRALESKHLRGLFRGPLPKLTKLGITLGLEPFEEGLLFGVLDKVSDTLRYLTLRPTRDDLGSSPQTTLQFPRMKRLETLVMYASSLKCTTLMDSVQVGNELPMLQTIHFGNQSLTSLQQGIGPIRVNSVRTVYVHMGSTKYSDSARRLGDYTLETPRLILEAFPNIMRLHLTLDYYENADCVQGLSSLFQHFTQLRELSLNLGVNGPLFEREWNQVLLGISVEEEAEGSDPEMTDWNRLALKRNPLKSITNMTGLRGLFLQLSLAKFFEEFPVCCDAAFQLGFANMPRLHNVHFRGSFTVSPQIVQKWRESGRIFNSSPTLRCINN